MMVIGGERERERERAKQMHSSELCVDDALDLVSVLPENSLSYFHSIKTEAVGDCAAG